ncbi:hypothetical protein FRB97_009479 [Tulasnella sp. 331]|nr:hypothetical protein FRB97_009479 [Tulasnella sp. 331]
MAPAIPDKIPCTTVPEFTSQLRDVQPPLNLPETEDNWEKISRALLHLAALARGGAHKLEPEFLNAIKANYKPITTSMLTERTRLSASALELVSAIAPRLGSRFEALVAIFMPSLLRVLTRPNKVFVSRAQTCLNLIVEHCHLPSLVPHLREAAKDKSVTLRLGVTEATLQLVNTWDRGTLDVREGTSTLTTRHRGNVEDIETIIKETAVDANPGVRQFSRQVFDKYAEVWPERLDAFTSPLTPTIRRYLNVGKRKAPVPAAPLGKAKAPRPPSPKQKPMEIQSSVPSGPSRPVRPITVQAVRRPMPIATQSEASSSSRSPSRPQSRLGIQGPSQPASSSSSTARWPPLPPSRPQSRAVVSNGVDALMNVEAHNAVRRTQPKNLMNMVSASSSANSVAPVHEPPSRPSSRAQHHSDPPELYPIQRPSSRTQQHYTRPPQPSQPPIQRPESRSQYRPANDEAYPMNGHPGASTSNNRSQAANGAVVRPSPNGVWPTAPLESNDITAAPKSMSAANFFRVQRPNTETAPLAHVAPRPVRPPVNTHRTVGAMDPPSRPARPVLKPGDPKPTFSAKLGFNVPPALPSPVPVLPQTNNLPEGVSENKGVLENQGKGKLDTIELITAASEQEVPTQSAQAVITVKADLGPAPSPPLAPHIALADARIPLVPRPASALSIATTASKAASSAASTQQRTQKAAMIQNRAGALASMPNTRAALSKAPYPETAPALPAVTGSVAQETPATLRPIAAILAVTAVDSGSGSGTKRPAVLQKRGGAVAQAGQVGGFAPTRRRPGVAEPTLSQLAKQKPTKTFVPTIKKPDLPPPPTVAQRKVVQAIDKKVVTSSKVVAKAGAAQRIVGGFSKALLSAPKVALPLVPIPKEVLMAAQVPLPPMTPDEIPLLAVELDEMPLPTMEIDEVDAEVQLTPRDGDGPELVSERGDEADRADTEPDSSIHPQPINPAYEPLLDLDMTINMGHTTTAPLRSQTLFSPLRGDLMDFDVSVVLPHDLFAPLAAATPQPITVLRDQPSEHSPSAHTPIKHHSRTRVKGKDIVGEEDVYVERVALGEREINIMS